MKFETSAALLMMLGAASARPDAVRLFNKPRHTLTASAKFRREVPQEKSHNKFLTGVRDALNLNNVDQVVDPVFALLGNAAAAAGAGKVTDFDCLQQRVADQAFTNAKEANDVEGMTNALIFRALERNTGKVGLASVLCTSETAKNPEIAALQQHQDPASDGAAALNKQITLDLAVQLASVGADPQLALQSGTFAPGEIGDATAAGNTCDTDGDEEGCIFTENLLVEDATAEEIDAAVAAGGSGNAGDDSAADDSADDECVDDDTAGDDASADNGNADDAADDECVDDDTTGDDATVDNGNANNGTGNANTGSNNGNSTATPTTGADASNVNAFTGTLGAAPIPITSDAASNRPFSVNGNSFQNIGAAIQRACDVQKNQCANAANSGGDFSVSDCDAQQQECVQQQAAAKARMVRRATSFGRF